jgi:hypothetical protein
MSIAVELAIIIGLKNNPKKLISSRYSVKKVTENDLTI